MLRIEFIGLLIAVLLQLSRGQQYCTVDRGNAGSDSGGSINATHAAGTLAYCLEGTPARYVSITYVGTIDFSALIHSMMRSDLVLLSNHDATILQNGDNTKMWFPSVTGSLTLQGLRVLRNSTAPVILIYYDGPGLQVRIEDCNFSPKEAQEAEGSSAAVQINNADSISIYSTMFDRMGQALSVETVGHSVSISNSLFLHSYATINAGSGTAFVTIKDCNFLDDTPGSLFQISAANANVNLQNSTFFYLPTKIGANNLALDSIVTINSTLPEAIWSEITNHTEIVNMRCLHPNETAENTCIYTSSPPSASITIAFSTLQGAIYVKELTLEIYSSIISGSLSLNNTVETNLVSFNNFYQNITIELLEVLNFTGGGEIFDSDIWPVECAEAAQGAEFATAAVLDPLHLLSNFCRPLDTIVLGVGIYCTKGDFGDSDAMGKLRLPVSCDLGALQSVSGYLPPVVCIGCNDSAISKGVQIVHEHINDSPDFIVSPLSGGVTPRRDLGTGVNFGSISVIDHASGDIISEYPLGASHISYQISQPTLNQTMDDISGELVDIYSFGFKGELPNGATLEIKFTLVTAPIRIAFASTSFIVDPDHSKWFVHVSNWPEAMASEDRLLLAMNMYSKDGSLLANNFTTADNLAFFPFNTENSAVGVRCPLVCLIDGDTETPHPVTVTATPVDEDLIYFEFIFPAIATELVYDPDISVLVGSGDNQQSKDSNSSGMEVWLLAIIIGAPILVVMVAGVLLIVVVSWVINKTRRRPSSISSVNFTDDATSASASSVKLWSDEPL